METNPNPTAILSSYTDQEKTAYLATLAALATSDREATNEELDHLLQISTEAGLSETQQEKIIDAAKDASGQDLKNSLDVLRKSDLRYALITDLIALGHADNNYTPEEKGNIEKISRYLDLDEDQFSVLDQYVQKAADQERTPEEYSKPDFLSSTGMKDKLSNAGFSMDSIGKGLLGFLAPLVLGGLASGGFGKRRSGQNSNQGGGLGGMLGGALSGNGNSSGMSGGLGSILGGLMGSRNSGALGGILGKLLR